MKSLGDSKTVTLGGITYHMGTKVENTTDGMNNTKTPNTLVYDNEKLYITRKDSDEIKFYRVWSDNELQLTTLFPGVPNATASSNPSATGNTVGEQQNTDDKPVEPKVDEVKNNIKPKK